MSNLNKVTVIPNFMDATKMKSIIEYIDSNLHKFSSPQELRHVLMFGYQNGYDADAYTDFSILNSVSDIITKEYFPALEKATYELYGDDGDTVVSNLWISKQLPGSVLLLHHDDDNGHNPQFKYSCILYLNTVDSGTLEFPDLNFSYRPKAGDLVIFPSMGDKMSHEIKEINHERYSMPTWLASRKYALKY
jgi:hypothetical protein